MIHEVVFFVIDKPGSRQSMLVEILISCHPGAEDAPITSRQMLNEDARLIFRARVSLTGCLHIPFSQESHGTFLFEVTVVNKKQ